MESTSLSTKLKRAFSLEIVFELISILIYAIYSYIHLVLRFIFPRRLKSLDGEVFLITGSASGIGREVVYNIATNHPKTTLVLWDSNDTANKQILEAVKLLGVEVFCYNVDVTNRAQVEETAKKVIEEVGCVTILFNNAGVIGLSEFLSMSPEKMERSMDVNVTAHFWTLRAFLPDMIENNYGHIVTTCSGAGHIGIRYDGPYSASKFAVRGYLESLKAEMRNHPLKPRIKFTTIFPSFVRTPLIKRVSYRFRMQSLFDPLEPRYVADCIVQGMRRNEENVFVPRIMEVILFVKGLMPRRLYDKIEDFIVQQVEFSDE